MTNSELTARLDAIREQNYPLALDFEDAEAIVDCIRRIMAEVPEDNQIFVRADYDDATSALFHPPHD